MTDYLRLWTAIIIVVAGPACATEADELTHMLHEFLAGVSDAATHDRFWAEDLIYTSSNGTRTGKADIMAGFDTDDAADAAGSGPVYTAEDIRIQVYGTTAILAFRLVATAAEGAEVQRYLNTGTFLKRDGRWQVIAWQATRISPS